MLTIGQIKKGQAIVYQGEPYIVIDSAHSKQGRAGAVLRVKIRNLRANNVLEITFQGNDKIDEADLVYRKCQFLYADDNAVYFMDPNFEQFGLNKDVAEDSLKYLKEGQSVDIAFWQGSPVTLKLPPKVDLLVSEAAPAVRGDTANNASKIVKLETGLEISVPMFIKEGDKIRINTESCAYVERA